MFNFTILIVSDLRVDAEGSTRCFRQANRRHFDLSRCVFGCEKGLDSRLETSFVRPFKRRRVAGDGQPRRREDLNQEPDLSMAAAGAVVEHKLQAAALSVGAGDYQSVPVRNPCIVGAPSQGDRAGKRAGLGQNVSYIHGELSRLIAKLSNPA